ncbi:MAG: hypothetical protein ABI141_03525 [Gemmatimonadaceae bacterium]
MNVSRSAALLLLATLAIGILLGALGAGALRPRLERRPPFAGPPGSPGMRGQGRPGGRFGFAEHMVEVIAPRDSAQSAAVRVIIERTAAHNRALIEQLNGSLRASVDSMRSELAPILDAGQRDRLERATNQLPPVRGPGAPGRRGGPGGPRPDGPPPREGPPAP